MRSIVFVLALVAFGCQEGTEVEPGPTPGGPTDAGQAAAPSRSGEDSPGVLELRFTPVLAEWAQRYATPLPGSYDAPLPELEAERREALMEQLDLATTTSRTMRRYADDAQKELREAGDAAAAALAAWIEREGTVPEQAREAFAIFEAAPPAPLVSACLRWLDDPRPWLRGASYRLLGATRSAHVLPRLLRRLKYEEDLALYPILCTSVAALGNPSPIAHMLQRLGIEGQAEMAGEVLVQLVHLFGEEPYVPADGWTGLRAKAYRILDDFRREGELLDAKRPALGPPPLPTPPPPPPGPFETLAQREWWLFVRHLADEQLRPVDDARFVGRQSGRMAVPLVQEALFAHNDYVRVHSLEIARQLGEPARPCGDRTYALLNDRFVRAYAIETIGAIHDERAIDVYELLLRPQNKAPELEHVAALKGLAAFGDPRGIAIAQPLLAEAETPLEVRVYAAHAVDLCARGAQQKARAFLEGLLEAEQYHAPTLRELLAK